MVMHPHIEVKSSVISGHGMYVVKPIAKGEVLWHEEEDESKYVVHEDVVQTWPEDVRKKFYNFAYQVGEGLWSGVPEGVESDGSEYMNHCCEPNCVFIRGGSAMIATRDLVAGDEVTYDYATSETEVSRHTPFQCRCGAATCRGVVEGTDWRKPEIQEKYAGQFTSFVQGLIDGLKAEERAAGEGSA